MKEVWKDIKGFNGLYKISNNGRVMSLKNNEQRILKGRINKDGYLIVALYGVIRKDISIHRLVALHFIDGYKQGLQVNHINEIKTDNRASNLEWVTSTYNNNYGNRLIKSAEKKRKPIIMFDLSGNFIKRFSCRKEAEMETGIKTIHHCVKYPNKHKTAGGYRWAYAN